MGQPSKRDAALAMRRKVLGDKYVDAAVSRPDSEALQSYITDVAWSVWTRGALSTRDRSLLVLAMLAVMGQQEEFRLHVRSSPNAGVSDEEIDELVFQIIAYGGAPAGIAARRNILAVRAEEQAQV
jgi:4-carboxymuconolactone decarboxylase